MHNYDDQCCLSPQFNFMIFYKLSCVEITVKTILKLTLVEALLLDFLLEDKYRLLRK